MSAAITLRSFIAAVLAFLLFIGIVTIPLAPLPLFFMGLSYAIPAALLSGAFFTTLLAIIGGMPLAVVSLLLFVIPSLLLTRQALLSRPVEQTEHNRSGDITRHEFYPPSALVLWIVLGAITLISALYGVFASSPGGLPAALINLLSQQPTAVNIFGLETFGLSDEALKALAFSMLVSMGASWAITIALNMVLAQRLAEWIGTNLRPKQNFDELKFPALLDGFLLLTIILSYALGGAWSIYFGTIALCIFVPYFLLGLSIIHAISRPLENRVWILGALYIALLLFAWIGIAVAMVGLLDPHLRLRKRFAPNAVKSEQQNTRRDPPEKE